MIDSLRRTLGSLAYVLIFFQITVLVSMASCAGGGSAGTGDRVFHGTLRTLGNVPASGIQVTIGETGESVITDENGVYTIRSNTTESSLEFFFEGPGLSASAMLTELSPSVMSISIDFVIDAEVNSVTPIRIDESSNDSGQSQDDNATPQVSICHYPGGNPENAHTITIAESALPAHLEHGDSEGMCVIDDTDDEQSSSDSSDNEDDDEQSSSSSSSPSNNTITICHNPSGNPRNAQTLTIDEAGLADHLAHGDTMGPC